MAWVCCNSLVSPIIQFLPRKHNTLHLLLAGRPRVAGKMGAASGGTYRINLASGCFERDMDLNSWAASRSTLSAALSKVNW